MPSPMHLTFGSIRLVRSPRLVGVALVAILLFAGCATRVPAPVEERGARAAKPVAAAPAPAVVAPAPEAERVPQTYTVKRGDTLHAIALDHGLDYRELAAWNNVENVNVIRVGQVLRLAPPGEPTAAGVTTAPLRTAPPVVSADARPSPSPSATPLVVPGPRNADNYKAQPKAVKEPYSEQALRDVARAMSAQPPPPAAEATAPTVVARAETKPAPAPATAPPSMPESRPTGDGDDEKLEWAWPASGKLITG